MADRILLLYLPSAHQRMLPFPPLGIATLAGCLRRRGIEAQIDDLEMKDWVRDRWRAPLLRPFARALPLHRNNPKQVFLDLEVVAEHLAARRFDARIVRCLRAWSGLLATPVSRFSHVGFSVMSKHQLTTSLCFAEHLARTCGVKTVFGGSFITPRLAPLLERYPFVDYLVFGEGEAPLAQLLRTSEPTEVDSLAFRHRGRAMVNRTVPPYERDLEPDFEGLPMELYRQHGSLLLPYETSKGCRNRCTFCITRRKGLLLKDPETVVDELARLQRRWDTDSFVFVDNAINVDRHYALELCRRIVQRGLRVRWSAYFIPEPEEQGYFEQLRAAGCIQLRWGVETLSETALREMNKSIDALGLAQALQRAHGAGIWNHLLFLVGHPGERAGDLVGLISFIVRNRRFFQSALVSPLDLERIDLAESTPTSYLRQGDHGRIIERDLLGIRYRSYEARHQATKRRLVRQALRACGVRYLDNFSRHKTRIERDQFIYRAFAGPHGEHR